MTFKLIESEGAVPIKAWVNGVPFERHAEVQLRYAAELPCVWPHVAVMPDAHAGIGSTVGSVIPTRKAIIPAAVGVDIGCGMVAARTTLTSQQLGDNAMGIFEEISKHVPHGRTDNGGENDRGAWRDPPDEVREGWGSLEPTFRLLVEKNPRLDTRRYLTQLGSLGTGNHFIEVCLDKQDRVWVMLHSGSRGIGNRIGTLFIETAKKEMERRGVVLKDQNLAYLEEGGASFQGYVEAVGWAQNYARLNRELMLARVFRGLRKAGLPKFEVTEDAVNCHHNYVQQETHFGEQLYVTRKGAVSARLGELGIIPGSMGARSFIVRGLGNAESFHSCSHGAGRVMSRTEARSKITLKQHREATAHVVCLKDESVLDESVAAYKDIDAVMAAQSDLVEIVHELTQIVCVKGGEGEDPKRKKKRERKREKNRLDSDDDLG